ncbi:hypothetical protein Leryth_003015 [Lithospermum erythrorhizon]|nr:hypothetical protein Leryth_003015 [Lithospermum erythrorhizon]
MAKHHYLLLLPQLFLFLHHISAANNPIGVNFTAASASTPQVAAYQTKNHHRQNQTLRFQRRYPPCFRQLRHLHHRLRRLTSLSFLSMVVTISARIKSTAS